MKLSTTIWLVFALCLLLVLAAMGWLSATALRLDRAEIEARRQAVLEEKVRLALWRMDSALAPTVAQESARPYFAYLAYFPVDRSFNRMFNARSKGETLIASPLLMENPPRILLHFQFDAIGNLTSPQLPPVARQGESSAELEKGQSAGAIQSARRELRPPEISKFVLDPEVQNNREKQFARLRKLITLDKLAALLPEPKPVELKIIDALVGANEAARGKVVMSSQKDSSDLSVDKSPQPPNEVALNSSSVPSADMPQQPPAYGQQSPALPGMGQNKIGSSLNKFDSQQNFPATQQLQMEQNRRDYKQRESVVMQNADAMQKSQAANLPANFPQDAFNDQLAGYPQKKAETAPQPNTDINGVLMTPLWIEGELFLARRVLVAGQQYVQGCLLDWPDIRGWLKSEIADLLPDAELVPASASDTAEESRLLAALPIRLVTGAVAVNGETSWSPLTISLAVAWICLMMTAAAIIGLLSGVIRLSTRRASFVTAVTHELRTPLTTFQMYAEMLAEDMVPEESQRKEYLKTLRAEAVRLTHLVENVLAYARLERGRLDRRRETITLGDLIGTMQNRLADRAAQAGMELVVEYSSPLPTNLHSVPGEELGGRAECAVGDIHVKTNTSAVEQILFNLVDNACKYAGSTGDKRIHLILQASDGIAQLHVEDHGPGIAPEMRCRLFRSFSKTAKEAAHSAPGVGLGLALSRRLARDLGGELSFEERHSTGACFILKLPLA